MGLMSFLFEYIRIGMEYRFKSFSFKHDEIAGKLLRDGIVIIPNYLDQGEVEMMLRSMPKKGAMRLSPEGTKNFFIDDANKIPDFSRFFDDTFISGIVETVIGPRAERLRCVAQINDYIGWTGSFEQFYHSDTWRHRIKAFLYLVDVDNENGPLDYLPGTQRGWWRWCDDWEVSKNAQTASDTYSHSPEAQYVGVFLPHRVRSILRRTRRPPTLAKGKAGTLVIFDGRGLHRATPLVSSYRVNLSSYWIEQNAHT